MTLRTQLILAFLLLAVVPLTGITVYSYVSSSEAYRQAVEDEGEELAQDMTRRMEGVRSELDYKIQSLGLKPFYALSAAPVKELEKDVEQTYSQFLSSLGDAAVYLESLEFSPAPPAIEGDAGSPLEPDLPRPALPPPPPPIKGSPAEPVVIVLAEQEVPGDEVAVPEANGEYDFSFHMGDERIVLSYRSGPATVNVPGLNPEAGGQLKKEGYRRRHEIRIREIVQKAQRHAVAVSMMINENNLETVTKLAEEKLKVEQEKVKDLEKDWKMVAGDRSKCLDFAAPVRMSGERIGEVKAQVNAREVLGSVLSRTKTREGEIPFSIDNDGRVYTQRPADIEQLEELQISMGDSRVIREVPEEWLLVARQHNDSGITFGIARPIGAGLQEIQKAAMSNFGWGMGMVCLALLGILPLSNRMTRNLATLAEGAEKMASGNLDVQVPVRSKDEFGRLAATFNRMGQDLKAHQARLVEQERLRKELEMCRRIQEEMLPRNPLRLPFAEVQGVSVPAREVGGDFFNYFPLPDGSVAVLIGVVSGKGVAAALLMANVQATLRAKLSENVDLAELARQLDSEIDAATPSNTYLTLFFGILDSTGRQLRWVNAGHNTQ
ncbi:MAG: SpoIIE family protein phosphatase, partial [Acidobacteriota bacterium]